MNFFLLATLAMLGYSVYGTLITHHVRKHDGLSIATVRNLSLIISMSPLLLLAEPSNFQILPQYLPKLLLAGLTGALSLSISLWALKFLPLGIHTTLNRIFSVLLVFIGSWLWFGEIPLPIEIIWIIPITIGGIALARKKVKLSHLDERTHIGILLITLGTALSSISFIQMSDVARNLDPFIAGYGWEVLIGICALIFGVIRWKFCGKNPFSNIKLPEACKIALVSSPTLIGTGAFALAVTQGSVGIANAIGTGSIFISVLLGGWLYQEKLTPRQWLWIGVCVCGLVGLGLVS